MIKKILVAGLLALSAVACGGNECEDAADKVDECGIKLTAEQQAKADDYEEECSGENECAAKCINEGSCEDLKNFHSDSPDLANPVLACAIKCGS